MPGFSVKYPLSKNVTDGYYGMNATIVEAIRQNVKNLVLTSPGERIMNPDYGVGLKRMLFEFVNTGSAAAIASETQYQFRKYLPQIKLVSVNILTSKENSDIAENAVVAKISYTIPTFGFTDEITIEEEIN